MAKLAVLLALLVRDTRKSSAACLMGCVETPVSTKEKRPGSTRPSVVMPTNGCASAAAARASVWVTNGVSGDGSWRPDNPGRWRRPNGNGMVGVAIVRQLTVPRAASRPVGSHDDVRPLPADRSADP